MKHPFSVFDEIALSREKIICPLMFGVSTSRRNPVFSAQELGAQHRAIFVPDMDRSPEGIAKSVMIPALAAQNKTYELHRSMTALRDSKKSLRW